jgi:glycosyltransferase involved in cell wall biosynthesis
MNILALTHWSYSDPLIQRFTLPNIRTIQKSTKGKVFLVTFEAAERKLSNEEYNSIEEKLRSEGIIPIFLKYHHYGIIAILSWMLYLPKLLYVIFKNDIHVIHSWCTPAGSLGYLLSVLTRKKLIVDNCEPHAEAMVENGTWSRNSLKFKLLFSLERLQVKRASNLIFAAPGMENYILSKYKVKVSNYYVKPACVDLDTFSFNSVKNKELLRQLKLEDKIVCLYAGKFGGIYLDDETFEFIAQCQKFWGSDKFRFLLLSNMSDEVLKEKATRHNINLDSINKTFAPHEEVPKYMGLADFALCPVKPVPSKKYCSPIKNGEYWALGLPVVITPNISVDSDIIKQYNAGAVIESLDEEGYIKAIRQIDTIIANKSRAEVYEKIRPLAEKYRNVNIAEKIYNEIYSAK